MAEYIKKALVAREIRKLLRVRESPVDIFQAGFEYGVNLAWVKIDKIPAADVAQVVHARWEMKSEDTTPGIYHVKKAFCTRCGKSNKQYRPPYCPHCGAKMDGEV